MIILPEKMPCENCAYAVWDSGDSSVGMPPHICDCDFPQYTALGNEIIENVLEENREKCPFWLPQFPRESERVRCPECNNPTWRYTDTPDDMENLEMEIECRHCKNRIKVSMYASNCPEITGD